MSSDGDPCGEFETKLLHLEKAEGEFLHDHFQSKCIDVLDTVCLMYNRGGVIYGVFVYALLCNTPPVIHGACKTEKVFAFMLSTMFAELRKRLITHLIPCQLTTPPISLKVGFGNVILNKAPVSHHSGGRLCTNIGQGSILTSALEITVVQVTAERADTTLSRIQ